MWKIIIIAVSLLLSAKAHPECHEIALISGSSNRVCDTQLSASSVWSPSKVFKLGNSRLDVKEISGKQVGCWHAKHLPRNEWIQVDFVAKRATITGIGTQGRGWTTGSQWVGSYVLKYSYDCVIWYTYTEQGKTREFIGNNDNNSLKRNRLKEPFSARCVRLYPKTWQQYVCMRWELYGCITKGSNTVCQDGGTTQPTEVGPQKCLQKCTQSFLQCTSQCKDTCN